LQRIRAPVCTLVTVVTVGPVTLIERNIFPEPHPAAKPTATSARARVAFTDGFYTSRPGWMSRLGSGVIPEHWPSRGLRRSARLDASGRERPECALRVTGRRIAIGLAGTLIALAAFVAWAAAWLEDQPPSQSTDPSHVGVALAGAFAAGFCINALWHLREASRGRAGWLAASGWFAVALIALSVVPFIAFASRLGG
jgi:hypothetical protein